MTKPKVIFRRHFSNALTVPLLLNVVERSCLAREIDIQVRSREEAVGRGDLLIYSLMTPFLHEMADEIGRMKSLGARIVIGGPHVDFENHELLLRLGATSVCASPAESGLIPVLESFLSGKLQEHPFWEAVPDSTVDISSFLPLSLRLPTLPPLELMRGCGYACPFCATSGHRKSLRDWGSIEHYLQELQKRKARRVNFLVPSALEYIAQGRDVESTLQRLFETCRGRGLELIEYGIFPSEIRPETVTDSRIDVLKRFVANKSLTMGLQTGYRVRAAEIGRNCEPQLLESAIDTMRSRGFGVNLDLIVGFPGEDAREFEESLDAATAFTLRSGVRLQVHRFFPLGRSPWQWRKPADLDRDKRERLDQLEGRGTITAGWRINDDQWRKYWDWLESRHPDWASRYS